MPYHTLEPEVAGGFGQHTVADVSTHPPTVTKLHYEFSGWLGDCLVESFPCFIITAEVSQAMAAAKLTGFEITDVEVSIAPEFNELYPDRQLPQREWLKPTGIPGHDDIAVTEKAVLVVSEETLSLFRNHGLQNCDVSQYSG